MNFHIKGFSPNKSLAAYHYDNFHRNLPSVATFAVHFLILLFIELAKIISYTEAKVSSGIGIQVIEVNGTKISMDMEMFFAIRIQSITSTGCGKFVAVVSQVLKKSCLLITTE